MSCNRCCGEVMVGDLVQREADGYTLTGSQICEVIAVKRENGYTSMRLNLECPDKDPELVKLLENPECWHKFKCGWKIIGEKDDN